MSQPKAVFTVLLLNLFNLNYSAAQDLYQSIRKAGPNPNIEELKKQTHDAERIRRVNEMNTEVKAANPPGNSKIVNHKSTDIDTSTDDDGDKIPSGRSSLEPKLGDTKMNGANFKNAATSPASRNGGYVRKEKSPDSIPAPSRIKVTTDDTPESLNFPGAND